MEVSLLEASGIPDGCFLVVRAGRMRQQAPVGANRFKLKFPQGIVAAGPFKVDLHVPLYGPSLGFSPLVPWFSGCSSKQDSLSTEIKLESKGGSIRVRLNVAKDLTASREPHPAAEKNSGVDARAYLDDHHLLKWLQDVMSDLLRDRPINPWEYIVNMARMKDPSSTFPSVSPIVNSANQPLSAGGMGIAANVGNLPQSPSIIENPEIHIASPNGNNAFRQEQARAVDSNLAKETQHFHALATQLATRVGDVAIPFDGMAADTEQRRSPGEVSAKAEMLAALERSSMAKVAAEALVERVSLPPQAPPEHGRSPKVTSKTDMLAANPMARLAAEALGERGTGQAWLQDQVMKMPPEWASSSSDPFPRQGFSESHGFQEDVAPPPPPGFGSPAPPAVFSYSGPQGNASGSSSFKPPRVPRDPTVDASLSRPRSLPSLALPNSQTLSGNAASGPLSLGAASGFAHSKQFASEVPEPPGTFADEMRVREMLTRVMGSGWNTPARLASGRNSPAGLSARSKPGSAAGGSARSGVGEASSLPQLS